MSNLQDILPPSISQDENIVAMTKALDVSYQQLAGMIINVLIYSRIDELAEDVIDLLAWQFHLESYDLAYTLEEKRSMVKKAIELHKYKGTPWSVTESLKAAGFFDAEVVEYGHNKYDGSFKYDGSRRYDSPGPYLFRVILDTGSVKGINPATITRIRKCINDYKNVRSHLLDIRFRTSLTKDSFSAADEPMPINITETYHYNGQRKYNGSIKYAGSCVTERVTNAS